MRALPRGSLLASIVLGTSIARAFPGAPSTTPTDAQRAEAKDHFQRGVALEQEGDDRGALAEMKRAYELSASLVALFNMGLLFDTIGDYVRADDALSEVLDSSSPSITPDIRERADKARTHARGRIATVEISVRGLDATGKEITALPEGSVVEVDGVEVGRWPLKGPLRVSVGSHVVGVQVAGEAPARKEASLAGETKTTITCELVPLEGKLAQLRVLSSVPRASVIVDGMHVADTPLASTIAIVPGKHVVELKRRGYATASTVIELPPGGIGEAKLEPRADAAEVAAIGSKLDAHASETAVTVTIDGDPQSIDSALLIAPGPHHVHAEKTGYFALDRDVEIEPGKTLNLSLVLTPTPETLAAFDSSVSSHRTWGIVGLTAGVIGAGVGGYFLYEYSSNKSSIDSSLATYGLGYDAVSAPQGCDFTNVRPLPAQPIIDACTTRGAQIDSDKSTNSTRLIIGGIGAGVGVVGLLFGVYELASAPDSSRYDSVRPKHDAPSVQLGLLTTPGSRGFTLTGVF
ncbi:MAG: PEGA domain-containing protein [Polyangiales bacterium]